MPKSSAYTAKVPDALGFIDYSAAENAVWADLHAQQIPAVQADAATPYLTGLKQIDLPTGHVPQCKEVSERLRALTGWSVTPVDALIGFAEFFDLLSRQIFPAASFIRSRKDFDYITEPDIFHELFGHTPLLTDARFAVFSQAIGAAGQRAQKADYAWLIRLYWFTIEFGLLEEFGQLKALGSGLASSPTELPYSVHSVQAKRRPFDVIDILRTPYRIDIHQPLYYVLQSPDQLFEAAERDLLADIATARGHGLFAPLYPPKAKQA